MQFNPFGSKPKGFQQIADLSAAVGLTVPAGVVSYAVLNAEAAGVRWRDDGVDPTSSVGMLIAQDAEVTYQGDLSAIRFIAASAGAKLNVSFYSATGGLLQP